MKVRRIAVIAMTLAVFGFNAPVAYAEDSASKSSDWDFSAAIYLWALGLNGTVGLAGLTAEIDESFIDTVSTPIRCLRCSCTVRHGGEKDGEASWTQPI